jgi:PAS domain S-box-containing protein
MSRVLIVDDIEQNRYLLETILAGYGFEVTSAGNGAEALEAGIGDPPDLVIADILMPVMDGFELCRRWKADDRLRRIPFLFYTATYTDPSDESFAYELGADGFLVKPVKPDVLMAFVRDALTRASGDAGPATLLPEPDQTEILRQYNEVLFRKLEKKVMQLEADIVERRRAEEALWEKEEFLDAIVENIPDMIIVKNAGDLRIERINRAGEALLGCDREEICGRYEWELFPGADEPSIRERDIMALERRCLIEIPRETIRPQTGGDRILHTKVIPVPDKEGRPRFLLGISEDITEKVVADEALNRAKKKMTFLNRITFDDLQNAVFSLSGYLELQKVLPASDQSRHFLNQQSSLVQQILESLTFARTYQDMGQHPPSWQCVMHTFLYGVSHIDMHRLSRDVQVDGLEIFADPLLERVFQILAENVLVHAKGATKIVVSHRQAEDGVKIVFEDDGQGIPEPLKATLFEKKTGDTGSLSLFLAQEILSITDITIAETGEPGKGARFELTVPKRGYRFVPISSPERTQHCEADEQF